MDEKGTHIYDSNSTRLIFVSPGKVCKLVGISNSPRMHGRHRGGGHRKHGGFFGRFFKHYDYWEEKKKSHLSSTREITKRLLDLGLTKGCTFKVIQGRSRGPVLVEIRGTRIALGHGLASKVLVEVLEGQA